MSNKYRPPIVIYQSIFTQASLYPCLLPLLHYEFVSLHHFERKSTLSIAKVFETSTFYHIFTNFNRE